MKIMLVTPYFVPKIGGLENYAYNLARELQAGGDEVFVVTANHGAAGSARDVFDGIRVIRLPILFKLSNSPVHPLWFFMLRKIIRVEKPDVINAHSPVPYMADMALFAAGKTPTVLTYHAGSMKKSKRIVDLVLGMYESIILPLLLRRADAIGLVYPEFITKKLRAQDTQKTFYAPPGINPAVLMPPGHQQAAGMNFELLYVGKIHSAYDWKGLSVLFASVRIITRTNQRVRLTVVGEGDAVERYEQLAAALEITPYVTFKGALQGAKLTAAYQHADVLVLPSISDAEAFGTVTIEAMACGTPVIASRIGGLRQVLETTGGGLLVEPNSPGAIAAAVQQLIVDEPLRKRLARTGLLSVRHDFVWQSIAETYQRQFARLVTARVPPAVQISPYFPPHLGGMENVVQEIASHLAMRDYPVHVMTSDIGYYRGFDDDRRLAGKITRIHSSEIARLPVMWNLVPRLLRLPRGSIFHVHVAQAFIPEIALAVARLRRHRFVAHFHLDVEGSGGWLSSVFRAYKKTLFPVMLRSADRVIVFSDAQRSLVVGTYGVTPERVQIIPNGVALDQHAAARRYRRAGTRLLYVGRLSSQKRVDRLLHAMKFLPPALHLDIVGTGDLQDDLQALTEQLALHNVTFHGALFGAPLQRMYQQADVFVIASEREGMPLVVLEAMAAGLPVIASDVLGTRELVAGTGVLVGNLEPAAFAAAIAEQLAAATLTDLSQRSLQKAAAYSWDSIITTLQNLYRELA
jgi:glycosyltransferase involved in cell wall biosynthesis